MLWIFKQTTQIQVCSAWRHRTFIVKLSWIQEWSTDCEVSEQDSQKKGTPGWTSSWIVPKGNQGKATLRVSSEWDRGEMIARFIGVTLDLYLSQDDDVFVTQTEVASRVASWEGHSRTMGLSKTTIYIYSYSHHHLLIWYYSSKHFAFLSKNENWSSGWSSSWSTLFREILLAFPNSFSSHVSCFHSSYTYSVNDDKDYESLRLHFSDDCCFDQRMQSEAVEMPEKESIDSHHLFLLPLPSLLPPLHLFQHKLSLFTTFVSHPLLFSVIIIWEEKLIPLILDVDSTSSTGFPPFFRWSCFAQIQWY
jgi:hypothetical protein